MIYMYCTHGCAADTESAIESWGIISDPTVSKGITIESNENCGGFRTVQNRKLYSKIRNRVYIDIDICHIYIITTKI